MKTFLLLYLWYSIFTSTLPSYWKTFHCPIIPEIYSSNRRPRISFVSEIYQYRWASNHSLYENSKPPTSDPYHCLLIVDNHLFNHPRQYLRDHILPIKWKDNSQQFSKVSRNRHLKLSTQTLTEITFEVTVKFVRLNHHPFPNPIQINIQTFTSHFVVTNLHFTSTDEPPFDHQWGGVAFHNRISGLNNTNTFLFIFLHCFTNFLLTANC